MNLGRATRLEQAIDGGAAFFFALCAGWSLFAWEIAPMGAVGGAGLGGVIALVVLNRVGSIGSGAGFEPVDAHYDEPVDDALLLEDRLDEPAEDSQVVRLFAVNGNRSGSLPGELASRINHFLGNERPMPRTAPVQPDAAQELYEALAEIRRTLR